MPAAKIKLLFLASRPENAGAMHLEWDLQALQRAFDTTRSNDRFLTRFLWAPTKADLIDSLNLFKPDIVHFSGHGGQASAEKEAGILLNTRAAQPAYLEEQNLLSLLRGLRADRPKLLVLASCWGLGIARSATSFVSCAVGCPSTMSDAVARGFIHGFYASIAAGRSVRDAYDIGLSGIPASILLDHRPLLEWAHDVDPASIVLVGQESERHEPTAEIQRLLDLGLPAEAAFRAETALRDQPANGRLLYYLALARMNGRTPRALVSLEEARSIESLLERALQVSAILVDGQASGGWEGCALLFRAWLKEDLYLRQGFLSGGPDLEALLNQALRTQPERADLVRLSRLFPSGESNRARSYLDRLLAQAKT